MKKPQLNFTINTIMTVCMSAIIGTGFLIKFNLISGQKRWLVYGENVELYVMGMDRHQWGTVHLILGFMLIGLLAVHIFLHWNIIISVYKKIIEQPILNKFVALGFIVICVMLILVPLFIKPEIKPIKKGNGRHVTLVIDQFLLKDKVFQFLYKNSW